MLALRGWLFFGVLLLGTAAFAQQEGEGRISLEPGWRLTPNDYFAKHAQAAGYPLLKTSYGGPSFMASFGYGAIEHLEIAIDLFAGGEYLDLGNVSRKMTSISYGALAGVRTQPELGAGWSVSLGLDTGAVLVNESGGLGSSEHFTNAWAGEVGIHKKVSPLVTLGLEYRLILARGFVNEIGSVNGGGSWLGFSISFRAASQSPLPTDFR